MVASRRAANGFPNERWPWPRTRTLCSVLPRRIPARGFTARAVPHTGRWDTQFLSSVRASQPNVAPEEATEERINEKRNLHIRAVQARFDYRMGKYLARLERTQQNWRPQTAQKESLLRDFKNGTLMQRVNEATLAHGHGRLRRPDGTQFDIGGNHGLTRQFLDGTSPATAAEFHD